MKYFEISDLSFIIVSFYALCLLFLMLYGLHRYRILYLYWKYHKKTGTPPLTPGPLAFYPRVTVQLPVYNEIYVVDRLIEAVCKLEYPQDKLEIQVLDDSTDATVEIVGEKVIKLQSQGFQITQLRRAHRQGYKAGALNYGMDLAQGEFLAIFDADFVPPSNFLMATLPYFSDPNVGMVQTRWGHLNADTSLLTRIQALFLDGHFQLEHTARNKSGAFFNFNGTAGIWRKEAITSVGGWSPRTLTEDLDLSFRSQLAGWKFVYVPDIVCPAELPADIHSFHSQQRRWTQGAIQVARRLLKDLWKSKIPFFVKLEGTAHLTANLGYLLTVLISVLLLPSLLLRHQLHWSGLKWIEGISFFITTFSVGAFYAVSQRELYPDWKWRIRDLFALMSFGIGMCLNNAIAVWRGLFDADSEFVRTPKWGDGHRVKSGVDPIYSRRGAWIIPGLFAAYSLVTLGVASWIKDWVALPFIFFFVFGFSYVTKLSFLKQPLTE